MNFKQNATITLIRIVLTYLVFPLIPVFLSFIFASDKFSSEFIEVYNIIFAAGVISILLLEMVIVGSDSKYEKQYILLSVLFLGIIFYQNYNLHLIYTVTMLITSLLVISLRFPLKKIFLNNNFLSDK